MTASLFATLFVLAVALSVIVRVWLARRHLRHVAAHRDAVPAAFADSIELSAHRKSADYTVAKLRLGLVELAIGTAWLLWLTVGGGLQAMTELASGIHAKAGILAGLLLFGILAIAGFVIDLPSTLYRVFGLEARFGFNRMTPRLFIADTLKQGLLAVLIGAPLLAVVLWLMTAAGENWWAWAWGFWLSVNLAGMVIYPVFIAPMFNKFEPLADASLADRVNALLVRCGFRSKGLFVMDGSRRSAHGNAYFTGFGAGKRIVFFDTLIKSLQPSEIEAVLAHELGHFRHRHLWQRLGIVALLSFALLALLGWLSQQIWFYNGLGLDEPSPAGALILFSLALPVLLFPFSPLMSMWSRKHEFEADAYAASHANARDLVSALVKLYRDNASTLTPDPLYSLFYDSHPPAAIRIARLQAT
ncbi:M48 family metallopeptidase [Uliginosibacterium sp. H1]|uniref:M48 family metallopeptidase n=1 Tax=Uliginosibacterium sp. H1 TaxID=3114757 RepID=UPI002E17F772|nr:M48 family metallopeptidase [Uliginosibacterium sp. H1]